MSFGDRLKHAWDAFNRDPTNLNVPSTPNIYVSSSRPDRTRMTRGNERSIVTSIYNRIAMDVASVSFEHCNVDDNGWYTASRESGLNTCLTLEANIDQSGREFIQDLVTSMFDEGVIAAVPVETSINPNISTSFEINSIRVGRIIEWYPDAVKIKVYNDKTGRREEIIMKKSAVAIITNPLYEVMNEPNSTAQRLIRKLSLLDAIDEQSGSGKLDLIIQLPYVIKSESRKKQAEERRTQIEEQLSGSKYGIAYTDGTERITQLNRAVENNLMNQIEWLTGQLYSQLGITVNVFNGTANEQELKNYYTRTVEPICAAITNEMKRKFLTKTARSQKQSVCYFLDPFKLSPMTDIANVADSFTRNAIMTSNEIRGIVGLKPSTEPVADELSNKNINPTNPKNSEGTPSDSGATSEDAKKLFNDMLDDLDKEIDNILGPIEKNAKEE